MNKVVDTRDRADPGELAGFSGSMWFREWGTKTFKYLWALLKLTYPQIRNVVSVQCHWTVPFILPCDHPESGLWPVSVSWRSVQPWAMRREPPLLFLEGRVTQCEPRWFRPDRACWSMLWLSHQTLIALLHSPACWASCVGVRERGRRVADGQKPGACVSNLESQTSQEGCVCVCGGWGCCVFARVGRGLPYLPCVITS